MKRKHEISKWKNVYNPPSINIYKQIRRWQLTYPEQYYWSMANLYWADKICSSKHLYNQYKPVQYFSRACLPCDIHSLLQALWHMCRRCSLHVHEFANCTSTQKNDLVTQTHNNKFCSVRCEYYQRYLFKARHELY